MGLFAHKPIGWECLTLIKAAFIQVEIIVKYHGGIRLNKAWVAAVIVGIIARGKGSSGA